MKSFVAFVCLILSLLAAPLSAQQTDPDVVWVQVEARPTLVEARAQAALYAGRLADVNGFQTTNGWYSVVLGPYLRSDAEQVLNVYRNEGQIPGDSFISGSRPLVAQFWPQGVDLIGRGTIGAGAVQVVPVTGTNTDDISDTETVAQARRSEAELTRDERKALQIALQADGFYTSAIDGAFGRGTRRSMSDWQAANGYEVTGVLTTRQRTVLLDHYNAPLISVGMAPMQDSRAGVAMDLPLGAVNFARYEPPFVHFDPAGGSDMRVLLISQDGDQATLHGLYDIMQTLEIVPLEGPRSRKKNSFVLEGRNDRIVSHTEARLKDGEIKGFTLIWPTGDEKRRARVLMAMQQSFARLPGALDPAAGDNTAQDIDLIAGLEIRKPRLSRSGFYVDVRGTVVTTAEVTQGCTRITLDGEYRAELVASDTALGVAILKPAEGLAPMQVARFSPAKGRLQSDVAVAGYSYQGALGAPSVTYGTLADIRGLQGETELSRLALASLPGDAGGPVVDASGGVLGMLLPRPGGSRQLPEDVNLAADATAIAAFLDAQGLVAEPFEPDGAINPVDLNRLAGDMTVLVSCWD